MYTDPQIHSRSGRGFGKGNLGRRGIAKFCETHVCNAVCRYLGLPPVGAPAPPWQALGWSGTMGIKDRARQAPAPWRKERPPGPSE